MISSLSCFSRRHIGPSPTETDAMLATLGCDSFDQLIDEVVPEDIRNRGPLHLPEPLTEEEALRRLRSIMEPTGAAAESV